MYDIELHGGTLDGTTETVEEHPWPLRQLIFGTEVYRNDDLAAVADPFSFTFYRDVDTGAGEIPPEEGRRGPQGIYGPQGIEGMPGAQGVQGVQGNQGPQGNTGATGAPGATGPQGNTGAAGPQGSQGIQGPAGVAGPQGAVGAQGAVGPAGAAGAVGPAGPVAARYQSVYTTAVIADRAYESGVLAMRKSYRILKVSANDYSRVRLYGTSAQRDADVNRQLGVDPARSTNHGVVMDMGLVPPAPLALLTSPLIDGADMKAVTDGSIPIIVTNFSGLAKSIVVTIDYLSVE